MDLAVFMLYSTGFPVGTALACTWNQELVEKMGIQGNRDDRLDRPAQYSRTDQSWETASGDYKVNFGASVEDIRVTLFYRQGKPMSIKCHDVLRPSMELNL